MNRPRGSTTLRGLVAAVIAGTASGGWMPHPPHGDQAARDSVVVIVHEGTRLAIDLSPDGRTIVFDLLGQLWLLPAQGGTAVPLTDAVRDTSEDQSPAFSPDGRWVAFVADRPGGTGLFVVSRDGGPVRRLTTDSGRAAPSGRPTWSPDGRRLAFIYQNRQVRVLDVATGGQRVLAVESLPRGTQRTPELAWSRDGARLLFSGPGVPTRRGGRLFEVPAEGGVARALAGDPYGRTPEPAPDGRRLAFFADDSSGRYQLWVADSALVAGRVTSQADVTPLSAQWTPDGRELVYHADGRLWRVPAAGGTPREIPFTVRLAIPRRTVRAAGQRFAEPGSAVRAHGFGGLALSPSGRRIAMLALDTLWVFEVGARPRSVGPVPPTADGLTWSPDESEVAWSAGPGGADDLFATEIASGTTRRLTALEGAETRPAFSPDGERLAFVHWIAPTTPAFRATLRVAPARGAPITAVESTQTLAQGYPWWGFFGLGQEQPLWSPDSRAVLAYGRLRFLSGDSVPVTLPPEHESAAFLLWLADSSLRYIYDELLWRADLAAPFERAGTPSRVSDDAVLYPSAARDGSVLYLSADGLQVRRPDGSVERLGWPLGYRVPVPVPVLLRNVRVVAGDAPADPVLHDILLRGGRIERVLPAGSVAAPRGVQAIDGAGRWAMPGLIDVHAHSWDDAVLPGALYYGVTTVRDMGSTGIARLVGHDDAIRAGLRDGPRIVAGGIQFWGAGGPSAPGALGPSNDAARNRAMEMLRAFGASYVKMRWFANWQAGARLVGAAADQGWPVSGHEATQLPLVAAGIAGQEHLGPSATRTGKLIYADVVELWRAAGMYNTPTIIGYSSQATAYSDTSLRRRIEGDPLVTPFVRWWRYRMDERSAQWYGQAVDFARRSAGTAYRGGVRIVAGSDAPAIPWALQIELEELVAAGLPPRAALAAATTEAARVLGAEGQLGVVGPGALADLVLLDADPRQDIRNTQRIWMVIKGGEVVDRPRLQRMAATGGVSEALLRGAQR